MARGTLLALQTFNTHRKSLRWEEAVPDLSRGERLQIMLTPEELNVVDTWRFNTRMPSRAAAIRELIRRGLHADGFKLAELGSKSKDFGIAEFE